MLSRVKGKEKNKTGQHKSGPLHLRTNNPRCYNLKHYATIFMPNLEMRKSTPRKAE